MEPSVLIDPKVTDCQGWKIFTVSQNKKKGFEKGNLNGG